MTTETIQSKARIILEVVFWAGVILAAIFGLVFTAIHLASTVLNLWQSTFQ
jgi:hypothetical protein